jgi:hypothetical protein
MPKSVDIADVAAKLDLIRKRLMGTARPARMVGKERVRSGRA